MFTEVLHQAAATQEKKEQDRSSGQQELCGFAMPAPRWLWGKWWGVERVVGEWWYVKRVVGKRWGVESVVGKRWGVERVVGKWWGAERVVGKRVLPGKTMPVFLRRACRSSRTLPG
jgi:hypothetical protein